MLKEIAIADAYGSGFEFSSKEKINIHNNLKKYSSHDLYLMAAKYTDDTQMSIAIAELIIANSDWSNASIASKFVECFKRDPRLGYSKGFYKILNTVDSGSELISMLKNDSDRNGAAMRSVPLGTIQDKNELLWKAKAQAMVTHNTEIGIRSSCAVALAAHFGLYSHGKLSELENFLEAESLSGWNYQWCGEVSVKAFDTVSAAFSALLSCRNIHDLLIQCINLGGDTDSVAAIAVGLATCFDEYEKSLPVHLVAALDEPTYGLEYLEFLDSKLGGPNLDIKN